MLNDKVILITGGTGSFGKKSTEIALRAIAQRWGSVVGLEAAEAFELVRGVR